MSLLLADYQELTQNQMEKGIYEELIKEIPWFRLLQWKTIVGSGYTYDREDPDNLGTADFYNVGDTIVSTEAKTTQETAALYKLIGDADVDNLAQKSMSDINDQMAYQIAKKTKVLGHKFETQAVYGVQATSKGFDGLHTIVADSGTDQKLVMAADATGAAITCDKLDEAIDNLMAGVPDAIITTRRVRRNLTKYLRTVGSSETKREVYGHMWSVWGDADVPIVVCDKMLNTELCDSAGQFLTSTGGYTSSIFVVKFGEGGLLGLQNGGVTTEKWDKLESKDACRTRIKWYVSMALHSTLALVRICNITNAVATA